jgi:hypothetical protein
MSIEQMEPIDDRILDLFVSKRYHWKSLSPEQQRQIAVELAKHRFLEKHYLKFIEQALSDKEGFRRYRDLLNEAM